jgi:MFS transporter, ACS family, pantothenate transporter
MANMHGEWRHRHTRSSHVGEPLGKLCIISGQRPSSNTNSRCTSISVLYEMSGDTASSAPAQTALTVATESREKQHGAESGSDKGIKDEGVSEAITESHFSAVEQESVWRTVRRYIWDDPDKPEYEKKFLLKLDFFLLTYTCLGNFCKNTDQANISNAYVSGMKEALGMYGSELTYASNVFTAGYVVSQLPAVILVTKFRLSYVISTLEVLCAIFTFFSAEIKTYQQLYVIRFLVGLCEGAFFPCIIYLIASWYTKQERRKRTTLFYSTAILAGMFSVYLQTGAYSGLNGKMGRAGWQWLFIIVSST